MVAWLTEGQLVAENITHMPILLQNTWLRWLTWLRPCLIRPKPDLDFKIQILKPRGCKQTECWIRIRIMDTRRSNSVIMSSKRRRDVVLTSWLRYYCVICPLGGFLKTNAKSGSSFQPNFTVYHFSVRILSKCHCVVTLTFYCEIVDCELLKTKCLKFPLTLAHRRPSSWIQWIRLRGWFHGNPIYYVQVYTLGFIIIKLERNLDIMFVSWYESSIWWRGIFLFISCLC